MTIESAYEDFKSYRNQFEMNLSEDLSESDTRSKIIDFLFLKIFGWSESHINREGHVGSGYYDYRISIPGFAFVIEAKKSRATFSIPKYQRHVAIGLLEKGNKEIIDQVRKYLVDVGLSFAVLTNGTQIIIGRFINSNGKDWKDNKCVIFDGFDDIDARFIELYNLLSYEAVINYGVINLVTDGEIFSKRICSNINGYDEELVRNPLSSDLSVIIERFFGEINYEENEDSKELAIECFVENKEIRKNKSEIERYFSDAPPKLEKVIQARNYDSVQSQLVDEITSTPISKNDPTPPPIIVIGSKGAGKTTFIHHLFYAEFNNSKTEKYPYVYVDIRKYVGMEWVKCVPLLTKDILELISIKYEGMGLWDSKVLTRIYIHEIHRNDKGIWAGIKSVNEIEYEKKRGEFFEEKLKDDWNHLCKLSEYLIRERGIRLSIVLDNADQLDEQMQKNIFIYSQSLYRSSKALLIISLREGYYYRLRTHPPFDAFHSNVYHISAPSYGEVLAKRIEYALRTVDISGASRGTHNKGFRLRIDHESVKSFLVSLKKAIFGPQNSDILKFIEESSFPNIREGLDIFKLFLVSGYTEVDNYIMRQTSNYDSSVPIPIWEFVKSVALSNKKYYSDDRSIIFNLFNPANNSNFIFLKIKILAILSERLYAHSYSERFIDYSELVGIFNEKGYSEKAIKAEIEMLVKSRLIETEDLLSDTELPLNSRDNVRLSIAKKGDYYYLSLMNTFTYLELTLQTTPIHSEEYYRRLVHSFPYVDDKGKRDLILRTIEVELFLEYLDIEERRESICTDSTSIWIVDRIKSQGVSKDIERIKARVQNYRK